MSRTIDAVQEPAGGPRSRRGSAPAQPPPSHGFSLAVARLASVFTGISIFLALEAVLVAVVHHQQLAGPWELRVALLEIVPVGILASGTIALLATVTSALLEESERRAPRTLFAATASVCAAAVAVGVSTGPHFAHWPTRAAFTAIVAACAASASYLLAPRLARWKHRAPGWFGFALVPAIVVIIALNVRVLPRLYPAFHLALAIAAVWLAGWLGAILFKHIPPRIVSVAALVVLGLSGLGARLASTDLDNWDNVRLLFHARAPQLTHAVRLASLLAPRADTAPIGSALAPQRGAPEQQWIDWRKRDVLLISIDALRADHVGAYGYPRPTTPAIDELAKRGALFERAYCAMPHTSYSITSLMTGKYIRPLSLQGAGADSDTFAGLMRLYDYRTAAFYPPSLFVVDRDAVAWAEQKGLDFEYRKIEYATAAHRVGQVERYLDRVAGEHRVFLWVHFFEPHEPYDPHPEHPFGDRDVDHYDSEIAASDKAVGDLVAKVRKRRPGTVVILTGDHGEEFGEHGGYYHGTTVFEEQARVPLIIDTDGLEPRRIVEPVQLVDVLPTMLNALGVPRTPRLRGNDLGPWLAGKSRGNGFAFVESYDQVLLAEGSWRLVCERKVDACALFDLATDPGQRHDRAAGQVERAGAMRARLREVESSHGSFELAGARLEGKALPPALVRAIAGDVNAARDVSALLDDADVVLRRRAAQVLFDLKSKDSAAALSLALTRDEDQDVRRWCAVALTRMGQGAPLTEELLGGQDVAWKRLAAFALADAGDPRGEAVLVDWWTAGGLPFERARDIIAAFARIRSKAAVVPLTRSLDNVHLRPHIAAALAEIGDPYGRIALLSRFSEERYENSRQAIAKALVTLGAGAEMAPPLARFLGVSDAMANGVQYALDARIAAQLGGPDERSREAVRRAGAEGVAVKVVIPKGGNGRGYRVVVRARAAGDQAATIRFGFAARGAASRGEGPALQRLDPDTVVTLTVPPQGWREIAASLPAMAKLAGARPAEAIIASDGQVDIDGFVVVPLADEIPSPPPEPWEGKQDSEDEAPHDGPG